MPGTLMEILRQWVYIPVPRDMSPSPTGYLPESIQMQEILPLSHPRGMALTLPISSLELEERPVQDFVPPQSFWGISHPSVFDPAYTIATGLEYSSDEWIADQNWSRPDTGVVHAFQGSHWGNWQFAVDGQDKDTRQITWSKGGFQEARGAQSGAQWYVENVRELAT